jgi:hypothetical protein
MLARKAKNDPSSIYNGSIPYCCNTLGGLWRWESRKRFEAFQGAGTAGFDFERQVVSVGDNLSPTDFLPCEAAPSACSSIFWLSGNQVVG